MRYIRLIAAFVRQYLPGFPIGRAVKLILVAEPGLFTHDGGVLVCIVDLDGVDRAYSAKIRLQPFALIGRSGTPGGLDIFIYCLLGRIAAIARGYLYRFVISEQHPAGEQAFRCIGSGIGHIMRVISIGRVTEKDIILIKTGRPDAYTAFKIVLHADSYSGYMPPVTIFILVCSPMTSSFGKAAGLVREGIVYLVGKRPQRLITYIYTIAIAAELRAGCAVLQVIFAVMLIYPCTFHEGFQEGIVVGFPKTFPAMYIIVQVDELFSFADGLQCFTVYFAAVNGIGITGAMIEVQPAIVICKE